MNMAGQSGSSPVPAAFGGDIEIVCAIETDETDMEFITLYWED